MPYQNVTINGLYELVNNLNNINRTLESIDRRLEQLNKDYQTILSCDESTISDVKNDAVG